MIAYLKLAGLIFGSALIVNLQGWTLQAVILAALMLILGKKSFQRLKLLALPLALIFLLQLWLHLSLAPGLKIANLSLLVFLYTQITPVREISRVFDWLPPGLHLTLTIALNLIPVILNEAQNIRLVQLSRGAKNPLAIVVPLLHRTLQRSQQLALILETKTSRG